MWLVGDVRVRVHASVRLCERGGVRGGACACACL